MKQSALKIWVFKTFFYHLMLLVLRALMLLAWIRPPSYICIWSGRLLLVPQLENVEESTFPWLCPCFTSSLYISGLISRFYWLSLHGSANCSELLPSHLSARSPWVFQPIASGCTKGKADPVLHCPINYALKHILFLGFLDLTWE